MRKMLYLAVIALPFILSFNALGQQTDLVEGQQGSSEVTLGFYVDDAAGNQDWPREYDGRDFTGWGIERLEAYGFSGPYQSWIEARSLITGDEDVSVDLSLRNDLGIRLSTSALTHRLGRVPEINPYLSQIIYTGDGRPLSGFTGAGAPYGDTLIELSPETEIVLNRRVNNFGLKHYIGSSHNLAIIADWWQEREDGNCQTLFYDSSTYSGPMSINRSTSDGTLGADLRIGAKSVLNYRVSSTDFTDETQPAISGTFLDNIKPPSVKTSSNVLKARSRLSDKLYFTGVHINRSRSNETALVPSRAAYFFGSAVSNLGSPVNGRIEVESTNLALTFLASDTMSLTGRWRSYELDNLMPPLASSATATEPSNLNLSRKVDSTELGATFSGIRNAFLRFGFERRDTERKSGKLHPEMEGFDTEIIQQSTKSDIIRLSVRYNPTLRLSLSGNAESWNTDHPGYFGEPTDRTIANLNATYLLRDNFVLYGDFAHSNDENKDIRAEGPFPDTATTDEEELERERAAGQGYKNKLNSVNVGAWYGITNKLSLDANVARFSTDASELWVFGHDPGYPPHLPVETQDYAADSNQWSLGLNYKPRPKCRVYTRFLNSDSDGRATFTILPGGVTLPNGWVPVDVREKRWTIGLRHDLTSTERLMLEYSTSDWKDKINSGNDGKFSLWRLAWSSGF